MQIFFAEAHIRTVHRTASKMENRVAEFRVIAETKPGEVVKIVGNVEALGRWKVEKSIELKPAEK